MVISDEFVFVELNKTGSSHIQKLLRELVGGERRGVHNAPSADLVESNRDFLGSIRNPWDWYVSLWAYGCQGDGTLHRRLTTTRLRGHGWRHTPVEAAVNFWQDLTRSCGKWKKLYADPTDPDLFQRWLIRVHDEGVGPFTNSQGIGSMGLLSRFYASLFWHPDHKEQAVKNFGASDEAKHTDDKQCYIDYFIRTEYLESDLASFLVDVIDINSKVDLNKIYEADKTNSSSRKRNTGYYYDQSTLDLVDDKDGIIVDKFGYEPPLL